MTLNVKDAAGNVTPIETGLPPGRLAATASKPVVLSNEDKASLDAITTKLGTTLTVSGPATDAQMRAAPIPISLASAPLPTGAATDAKLTSILAAVTSATPAGTNTIGSVTNRSAKAVSTKLDGSTFNVATTGYSTGQIIGGPIKFASLFDAASSGIIQSIRARAASIQTVGINLYLFHAQPTGSYADKSVPNVGLFADRRHSDRIVHASHPN